MLQWRRMRCRSVITWTPIAIGPSQLGCAHGMFVAAQARLELSMHEGADARKSLQLGVNDLRACLDSAPQTDKGYVRAKLQSGVNQLVPRHCRPLITI